VKGLEGVGPKTAAEWLKSYKNLEGVLDNSGRLAPKSKQNLVYSSRELLMKNRELVTLHRRQLPASIRTEGKINGPAIVAELKELHLRVCAEEAARRYGGAVTA
jgi:5'-3' exonuclease